MGATTIAQIDVAAARGLCNEYGYTSLDVLTAVLNNAPLPDDQGRDLIPLIQQAKLVAINEQPPASKEPEE